MTTPQPARRPLYRPAPADPARTAPDSGTQTGLRRLAVELAGPVDPAAGPMPPAAPAGSGRRRLADPGAAR
ncbi:hypothetical protein ACW14Y_42830 (plasmid) [Kitasatospora sp. cg17-2]